MIRMDKGHVVKSGDILTADDLAPGMGASSYREWMIAVKERSRLARVIMGPKPIGMKAEGDPLHAQVEHGRWIVHCECGGTENVTPNDPVVFCFSCCNGPNDFNLRPVIFPSDLDRDIIKELLVKRKEHRDMNWLPGEPILNLELENTQLKKEGKAK